MANGMFFNPEEALAAERQARLGLALQSGATPVGASAQELGRNLSGALGGLFGAAPTESPVVQQARLRQGLVKSIDMTNPSSLANASRAALQAGDVEFGTSLADRYLQVSQKQKKEYPYAYKPGETKEFDATLPNGDPGKVNAQFWPELIDQDFGYGRGFVPVSGVKREPKVPTAIVNIGENELAKVSAKKVSEADEAAAMARRSNSSIQFLDKALNGLNTNQLSTAAAAVGNFGQLFGYSKDEIARLQASKSVLSDLALTQMEKMKGNSSDKDVAFVVGSGPELNQTPEGRKFLVEFIKKTNEREIERLNKMEEYISRPGNTQRTLWPSGKKSFNQEWGEYINTNPIIDQIKPPKVKIDTSKASKAFKDPSGNIWYEINGKIVNQFGEERK